MGIFRVDISIRFAIWARFLKVCFNRGNDWIGRSEYVSGKHVNERLQNLKHRVFEKTDSERQQLGRMGPTVF
jgi:hypothetical protein